MIILTESPTKVQGGLTSHVNGLISVVDTQDDIKLFGVDFTKAVSKKETKRVGVNSVVSVYPLKKNFFKELYHVANIKEFRLQMAKTINIFVKEIKSAKPDVILINGTTWRSWSLFQAAIQFDIPVIQYCGSSITLETKEYPARSRRVIRAVERSFDHPAILERIFPSEIALRTVEEKVWKKKIPNARVIHSGIGLSGYKKPSKQGSNVGMIYRWSSVKNPDYIFKLMSINKQRKGNIEFNIVTDIKESSRYYSKLVSGSNVHGPMEFEYLVEFYRSNDIIICPSYFETYGRVPLEALAHGIPALVNANMGVSEVYYKLGLGDLVIDFADPKYVYDKIVELKSFKVSKRIQREIRKQYSFESVYRQYVNIFRKSVSDAAKII
jgi:glycosyltransferase involved in cell wall biosynthesis